MKTTFSSSKNTFADHEDNLFVLKGQLSLKPHEIQDQLKQSTLKSSMLTEWRPKDILRKLPHIPKQAIFSRPRKNQDDQRQKDSYQKVSTLPYASDQDWHQKELLEKPTGKK